MTGASCSAIFFNVLIDKWDVELGDLIKKNYYKKSVSNATDLIRLNLKILCPEEIGQMVTWYEFVERLEVNKANFFPICL